MACFWINKTNSRFEVLKDGNRLFDTNFTQIVLHSGLIIFVRDLLSESVVLTAGTSIKLATGATKISIVSGATQAVYEIEAQHTLGAKALYNEILVAAGQKEGRVTDDASVAVASVILPPINRLSNLLVSCMEEIANGSSVRPAGSGGEGGSHAGDFDLGGGYQSTFNNGTYSVRFGRNRDLMAFQEFQVDDVQGAGSSYPSNDDNGSFHGPGPGVLRKRHSGGSGHGFDFDSLDSNGGGYGPREPLKRSKFHDEYARQLFVGNLPQTITESELADVFSAYGEIEKIHKITNNSPSTPFIAFVLYDFETAAQRALKNKANIQLKNADGSERRLNIQGVKPKAWRPPKRD